MANTEIKTGDVVSFWTALKVFTNSGTLVAKQGFAMTVTQVDGKNVKGILLHSDIEKAISTDKVTDLVLVSAGA